MEFRIADSFFDSLTKLTGDEQKSVKTTAFDLQMNPANPGMSLHKLDKAKDKNFWSVRVTRDIRIIVHRNQSSVLLCYVGHHDKAYEWAERRKLEVHPTTGAAQIVLVREKEVVIHRYVHEELHAAVTPERKPFADVADAVLLSYGVPREWLDTVRACTEDSLFNLIDVLPAEASEALLEHATGGRPKVVSERRREVQFELPKVSDDFIKCRRAAPDPFLHPDAQRRFRTIHNVEELESALEFPWDKWAVFLHPDQKQFVERNFTGPARVSGSAGTGKTVVALHRAVFLARANPESRVLLTTFSPILANSLRVKLRRLISSEPSLAERLEIYPIDALGIRLHKTNVGKPQLANRSLIAEYMIQASSDVQPHKFSPTFLIAEWEQVVDAWQLQSWEEYKDVKRLGRKTRLPEPQRFLLWSIFSRVIQRIKNENLLTVPGLFKVLTEVVSKSKRQPFDYVVVDESQDIGIHHLRFFSAFGANKANVLFFAGDQGQRIFQQPFSWKSLGIDIRGRAKTLRVNYRTSHQIRKQSDRLLGPEVADADGNVERRDNTISVFNGPEPVIKTFPESHEESKFVGSWIADLIKSGVAAHEIGVFVRSVSQLDRAIAALEVAGGPYNVLDDSVDAIGGKIAICTMHLAKGLEFKAVVVMACDDEVIPLQERIESVTDAADLEEVYNTERHLLYVACTRARDQLLVTGLEPASEFLDDLDKGSH